MLYVINGKYYILVSGYYKEVTVTRDRTGKNYDVKPVENANKNKIESGTVSDYSTISVEEAYSRNSGRSNNSL